MEKVVFARVPERMYSDLMRFCTERSIANGHRVTMREIVGQAVEQFLKAHRSVPGKRRA